MTGGGYYKTGPGGTQYIAKDPSVNDAEWRKNYYDSLGMEDDGHDRTDGNAGSGWGEGWHEQATRAANQGKSISMEDRRIAWGNEADYKVVEKNGPGGPETAAESQAAEEARLKAEEEQRIQAKQRSQEFQAKASALRNQFAESRKSYQNNTFTDAQNVNNSTNNARSALPEKFDVRAASQYGNVKRWDAENSNPSHSNI